MKKLIFIMALSIYSFRSQAAPVIKYNNTTIDTAKINKQIKKLNLKLEDLDTKLTETRNQIPVDSVLVVSTAAKAHDAQVKSKKRSSQAVDGDMDDVKLAQKQAKIAASQTSDATDAAKQLEKHRKKVKDLQKDILKVQKELNELQLSNTQ